MELTQLQWQNIGKKFTPIWWQINIWSATWNQIQNPWLPSNAAQINVQNWKAEIQQMHPGSPVFVNWNQVQKTSPVKFWDTISVWAGNNVVLWAHSKWTNLTAKQIWEHLWNLNFSWDQIADLTNKIFDFNWNQAIHKQIFTLIWILTVLLIGIIFSYTQLMWIWDKIKKEKNILDKKLIEINSQLEAASWILWKELVLDEWWATDEDCDPDIDDCESTTNTSAESLFDQINNLKSNISKLKTEQKKAITEMKKVAANPKETISKEEKKAQEEKMKIILENQKNISKINENFSKIIKDLKDDIKGFTDFKTEMKSDLKDFKKISSDITLNYNVLKEENQIRDNKIKALQNDEKSLEKKDDKTDVEIKKIQEEINSLELKIKNLQK